MTHPFLFGQYGKITSVFINKNPYFSNQDGIKYWNAFITYEDRIETVLAVMVNYFFLILEGSGDFKNSKTKPHGSINWHNYIL